MAGEATRGLTSWLHRAGAPLEEQSAPPPPPAGATDAASPLDIGLAILRAKEAIRRISPDKRALVEEIDVEEDDAEFDEKAHWGRRSAAARRKKLKAGRGKASAAAAPPGYSIKAFCVPQEAAAESKGDAKKAAEATEFIAGDPDYVAESTEHSSEIGGDEDTGRQDAAVEDEAERDDSSGSDERDEEETEDALMEEDTTATEQQQQQEAATSGSGPPPPPSGRPKRQAVLRAQEAQQVAKQQALALELALSGKKPAAGAMAAFVDLCTPPPPKHPSQTPVAKRARAAAAATTATLELASAPSVGRKRKLEMDKRTASPAAKGAATAATSFFLSEVDKKQLQEIEAVAKLREQLRKTREKDLAFFSGKTAVNPFFHAPAKPPTPLKPSASSSDEATDAAGDTDEPSGVARLRWAKDAAIFPAVQHVLCADVDASEEQLPVASSASLRRLQKKKPTNDTNDATADTGDNAVVLLVDDDDDDDSDESSRRFTSSAASMEQQVHTEMSLSDLFWFQQYREAATAAADSATAAADNGNDDARLRFPVEFESESALVDAVVDTYGVREKRMRELLASLVAAKAKRRDKARNLTLADQYAPVRASGVVGNKEALRVLASWLGAWKLGGGERERQSCFQAELFVFEGDESDSDELADLCRLFVLEGESGAGKSAAVYACAEELGYNVLEVNAGQSRAGRNIVEIVGEATQSTRVLHATSQGGTKSKSKATKKRGRKSVDSSAAHLSLVLFEDVDLVFDEDKGFLAALCSIAKRSKCPIVVTCRALPDGFPAAPQRLSQRLVRPSAHEFSAWLLLVAHLEALPLSPVLADTLARFFRCDVRQALHFLQTYAPQLAAKQRVAQWTWRPEAPRHDNDSDRGHRGDERPPVLVHAWTQYPARGFDMLASNLLPELARCGDATPDEAKSRAEKQADARLLESLAGTLDAVSVADVWGARDSEDEAASCFEQERRHARCLDLRAAGLSALLAPGGVGAAVLQAQPLPQTSSGACVRRSLEAALAEEQRRSRTPAMSAMMAKMELPLAALGGGAASARFSLDYLPMLSRLATASASHQQSRRRASRRHHYLSGVVSDLSLLDDILAFTTFERVGDSDQIVAASPSSSPLPS
ncbi:hypothetical protein PybrP1_012457 [[Pythium] brassicae (nom. inval.)]|nr:hypothetical protein PybrP1_012457 [[Pythium] brassicae (nom. inval.)]